MLSVVYEAGAAALLAASANASTKLPQATMACTRCNALPATIVCFSKSANAFVQSAHSASAVSKTSQSLGAQL